jgi:3-deoxy-D-manno-octulosonic acid (KDO) 8-phosphate synthase
MNKVSEKCHYCTTGLHMTRAMKIIEKIKRNLHLEVNMKIHISTKIILSPQACEHVKNTFTNNEKG